MVDVEDSVFTKIIKRELPSEILYEDDTVIVILDRFPNTEGQTLVIPKQQVDYVFDLDEKTYLHLMKVVAKISRALDKTFETLRTCVVIEGFDVPHVHVRLYPKTQKSLSLAPGSEQSDEELKRIGEKIRRSI